MVKVAVDTQELIPHTLLGVGVALTFFIIGSFVFGFSAILRSLNYPSFFGLLDTPTTKIVFIVLIAPLAEELLFRGVINYTLAQLFGDIPAIIAGGIIFASFHWLVYGGLFAIGALLAAATFGILSGILNQTTDDLTAGWAMHTAYNTLVVAFTFVSVSLPLALTGAP